MSIIEPEAGMDSLDYIFWLVTEHHVDINQAQRWTNYYYHGRKLV